MTIREGADLCIRLLHQLVGSTAAGLQEIYSRILGLVTRPGWTGGFYQKAGIFAHPTLHPKLAVPSSASACGLKEPGVNPQVKPMVN